MLSANISIGGLCFNVTSGAEPKKIIDCFSKILNMVKIDIPDEKKVGWYFQAALLREYVDNTDWIKIGFLRGAAIEYRLSLRDLQLTYSVIENRSAGGYIFVDV